jgi:maleylpyruvate isomerase
VDLDAGVSFEDVPVVVLDALIADAVVSFSARPGCPAARLVAAGRVPDVETVWTLGPPADDAPEVRGPTSALAGWVLGRDPGAGLVVGSGGALPQLGPWL